MNEMISGVSTGGSFEHVKWTQNALLGAEFPPQSWIVDRLVPDEGLTFIGGIKKVGKSWFTLQMAHAVASGTPFLQRPTKQTRVLYLALEDGPRRLRQRIEKQGGRSDLAITYQVVLSPLNTEGTQELVDLIEAERPGLVIIDTLAAAKSGKLDENAAGPMADLANALRRMAQNLHVAIVVVAHHGKSSHRDPGHDLRGSSALSAAADVIIGIYKDEGGRRMWAEGRDIEEVDLRLAFEPASCTWSVAHDARYVAQGVAEADVVRSLDALGEADASSVADCLGKHRETVQVTLKRMREDGKIAWRQEDGSQRILYRLKR